ncbi:MAG: hypothetical protein ACFCD0_26175 [Gemmataceae bacterium]
MSRNLMSWSLLVLVLSGANPTKGADLLKANQPTNKTYINPLVSEQVLTKQDLNKLTFPPRPRNSKSTFQLGVWLSQDKYNHGEPIHALFVLKNHGEEQGVNFLATWPKFGSTGINRGSIQVNAIRMELPKDSSPVQRAEGQKCILSSGPVSRVEQGSYWCFRRNLARGPLFPGTYVVSWKYGSQHSNEVSFRVLKTKGKRPATPRFIGSPKEHRWYDLVGDRVRLKVDANNVNHHRYLIENLRSRSWSNLASDLAAGHRVGEQHRWYTNPYDLPTSDKILKVSGKPVPAKNSKGHAPHIFEIQLKPVAAGQVLQFDNLYLRPSLIILPTKGATILTSEERMKRKKTAAAQDRKSAQRNAVVRNYQKTWKVRLERPQGWCRDLPFHGQAMCAVVVGTDHIRIRRGAQIDSIVDRVRSIHEATVISFWQGLVRTPWMKIHVPK